MNRTQARFIEQRGRRPHKVQVETFLAPSCLCFVRLSFLRSVFCVFYTRTERPTTVRETFILS